MRPNPRLSLSIAPPWSYGFNLDWLIETHGKRAIRVDTATHLSEGAKLELAEAAWRVRSRVRSALVKHMVANQLTEMLRAEESVRTERVNLLKKRLAVGEVSRPDVDTVQVELVTLRLALTAAEGRVEETRAILAASLGVPVASSKGLPIKWDALKNPPSPDTLTAEDLQSAGPPEPPRCTTNAYAV